MRITKSPEIRRAELIEAAMDLFDKNGIKDTQVSHIAKKVGVAKGLFYYYFESKEVIVAVVLKKVMDEIKLEADQIMENPNLDFYQKLTGCISLYLRLIDQFSGDEEKNLKNMLDIIGNNSIAYQAHNLLIVHLEKLVEQGNEQNILHLKYPKAMAKMLLYGLLELSKELLIDRKQLLTMIEQGLGLKENVLVLSNTSGGISDVITQPKFK